MPSLLLNGSVGIAVGSRVIRVHHVQDTVTIPETLSPQDLNTRADASPVRCLDPSTTATVGWHSVAVLATERSEQVLLDRTIFVGLARSSCRLEPSKRGHEGK